jgi:hypothetical protein
MSTTAAERVSLRDQAEAFVDNPTRFFGGSHRRMQTLPRDKLASLQLEALQLRFAQLRNRIPMLQKLSDKQAIHQVGVIDDVVPLLFEHTIYKSYPSVLLDQARFAELNRWLSKLTTFDLTQIDVSGCKLIDDWLDTMDRASPLLINHSSGTSGTMSFLPLSKRELDKHGETLAATCLHAFHPELDTPRRRLHVLHPHYRDGGSSHLRAQIAVRKYLAETEDRYHAAYPSRMSSDVLYLAGKIRAAQARGELDRLVIPPQLLARQKEFEAAQAEMPKVLDAFFDRAIESLRGEAVFIAGTWNLVHGIATKGLSRGMENVFGPGSVVFSGGGAKGMTPPDDWKRDVCRFFCVDQVQMSYAMTEVKAQHLQCERDHYHFVPWVIPFVLDSQTSQPLPRRGTVTGRAAFFDLGSETRWGGFITGDEITVDWDTECPCGRTSAFVVGDIQRISDKTGADDKITCAATESAHREAMEFLSTF